MGSPHPPEKHLGLPFSSSCVASTSVQGLSLQLPRCRTPGSLLSSTKPTWGAKCASIAPNLRKDLCRGCTEKLPRPRAPAPDLRGSGLRSAAPKSFVPALQTFNFRDQLLLGDLQGREVGGASPFSLLLELGEVFSTQEKGQEEGGVPLSPSLLALTDRKCPPAHLCAAQEAGPSSATPAPCLAFSSPSPRETDSPAHLSLGQRFPSPRQCLAKAGIKA